MVAVMLKKVPLLLTIRCIFSLVYYMLTVGDDFSTLNLLPTKQKTSAYIAECCLELVNIKQIGLMSCIVGRFCGSLCK